MPHQVNCREDNRHRFMSTGAIEKSPHSSKVNTQQIFTLQAIIITHYSLEFPEAWDQPVVGMGTFLAPGPRLDQTQV